MVSSHLSLGRYNFQQQPESNSFTDKKVKIKEGTHKNSLFDYHLAVGVFLLIICQIIVLYLVL